jgi:hypothetical protein
VLHAVSRLTTSSTTPELRKEAESFVGPTAPTSSKGLMAPPNLATALQLACPVVLRCVGKISAVETHVVQVAPMKKSRAVKAARTRLVRLDVPVEASQHSIKTLTPPAA